MRNIIIENCKKYLGKPYVWGGESDAEGGYDCSGYTYNVLRDSGFSVNRSTAQGYSKLGLETAYSKAQIGDLLFFGKSIYSITHIAIYAGNGMMYESTGSSKNTKNNPGKGVVLSKVSRRKDLVLIKNIISEKDAPSTVSTNVSRSWLQKGDVGQKVVDMQLMLIAVGYLCGDNGADGKFGGDTYSALCNFQKAYKLKVDGMYGESSKAKLELIYKAKEEIPVKYEKGKNYTLQTELKVRRGAGTNYSAKKHSALTPNGKKADADGDGALDIGTVVTCKKIKKVNTDIWMKIPSGWIAAFYNGKVYVK